MNSTLTQNLDTTTWVLREQQQQKQALEENFKNTQEMKQKTISKKEGEIWLRKNEEEWTHENFEINNNDNNSIKKCGKKMQIIFHPYILFIKEATSGGGGGGREKPQQQE